MQLSSFDLRALLDVRPGGGPVSLGGERAVVLDAAALGLLRREIVESFGLDAARDLLTRAGEAHGRRTARALEHAREWGSPREWQQAGALFQALQGLVVVDAVPRGPDDGPRPFAECLWHESYEADQHLEQLGWSDDPVCWTLTGFATGYLSYASGEDILCLETACRGRGDDACRLEGRRVADWGERVRPPRERDRSPGGARPLDAASVRPLEEIERDYLLAALAAHDGHRARTARALGIGEATLYRKLKRYGA